MRMHHDPQLNEQVGIDVALPDQGTARFMNARVSQEEFVDIKTAALREGLTLRQYLLQTHRAYQNQLPPD